MSFDNVEKLKSQLKIARDEIANLRFVLVILRRWKLLKFCYLLQESNKFSESCSKKRFRGDKEHFKRVQMWRLYSTRTEVRTKATRNDYEL